MTISRMNRSAFFLGAAVFIGACGGDVPNEADRDDDQEEAEPARPPRSSKQDLPDAGATAVDGSTGDNVPPPSSTGSVVDAGTSAPIDLDAGQDTPKEPASKFEFIVNRAQEVPACEAGKNIALGAGRVIIAASDKWVEVTVGAKFMSGPATTAHVHFGAAGKPGPIVLDFGKFGPKEVFFKRFTAADFPTKLPANAPADFPKNFAEFVTAVRNGKTYANVHTDACAGGEVRGQIVQQ